MSPTEMVHTGASLTQTRPSTPPGSPTDSSEHVVTLSSAQQFIEIVSTIVAMQMASSPASKRTCSHVPPENPTFQASERPLTLEHLEELLLKLVRAKSTESAGKSEDSESTTSEDTQQEDVVAPASRLEFKTVYEVWDSKAHKYTVRESAEPKVDELDQYAFVVRGRVDRETEETTFHVNIKSEWLRDVLRDVLKDVQVISLKEGKLSVEQKLLFHYLPELESCQIWNEIAPLDQLGSEHIRLLVDYLKQIYETTTRHLESLLQSGEITYDLLWALFKPNSFAFTTCTGTQRPRCVKYDFGEEKKTKSGSKYWNIECRYLDFDGADLRESSIELKIPTFRGVKRINALQAFPLRYHSDANRAKADLLRCGREFARLMGTHHRHCQGTAFVMFKGKQVKISVDSRIMIDAAFFRKINPNYSRRSITEDTDAGSIPLFDLIRVSREPPPEWTMICSFAVPRCQDSVSTTSCGMFRRVFRGCQDLMAMVCLKEFDRMGIIQLEGFVANLMPAERRALFGRGALDSLGLPNVPISISTIADAQRLLNNYAHEFDNTEGFIAPEDTKLPDGQDLLTKIFTEIPTEKKKLTVLAISSPMDIAKFSKEHTELLKNGIANVVLQGGYRMINDKLVPDSAAANNRFDLE
ncbi:hypothetical protein IFR05_016287 [Cadophora sp. M221]|nr:hypothetical protein IFR05_016287 [Cadophora sp. M221]